MNEKYDKLMECSANVMNLTMIMEKQLQTTKALSQANQGFKETTRSIFGQ